MRKLWLLFLLPTVLQAVDPMSKVTVKSDRAVIKKDKDAINVEYQENVQVILADSTTVLSNKLQVLGEKTDVQKIIFTDNVRMDRQNQKVTADEVEIIIGAKTCHLRGNVTVEQTKQKDSDIPMKTACQKAVLQWDTNSVELVGNQRQQVKTVIELGGKARNLQKKRKKQA